MSQKGVRYDWLPQCLSKATSENSKTAHFEHREAEEGRYEKDRGEQGGKMMTEGGQIRVILMKIKMKKKKMGYMLCLYQKLMTHNVS